MFCTKCGVQINENDRFCGNCGEAVRQRQVSQYMRGTPGQNKKRAVPIGVVAAIIAAAVLSFAIAAAGTIGTIAWYNKPVNRIDRAIRRGDVETVAELYGKLKKEPEEERVRREMSKLAEELQDSYLNGEMEYDEVMNTYDLLDEEILADDNRFGKIKKRVESVEASREACAEADALFDEGDYIGAKEKYMLVIEDDDLNYEDARSAIEECEKKITGMIVSTWSVEYDFGDWLYYDPYDYGSAYSLPARLVFDFNENGVGSMSVEVINQDMWVSAFMDYYIAFFEEYYGYDGASPDELEEFLQYIGYESLEEWAGGIEEDIDYFEGEYGTFEYSYDGNLLSIQYDDNSDSEELAADIEGDTMTLATTSEIDYWYWAGLDLPLVLTRDNAVI